VLDSSLAELQAALAARKVSSVELTRLFLDRSRALNGALNAYVTLDEETSLDQARKADERRAKGEADGPLAGIPVAHKDIFCTRELRTTCGSRMLEHYKSPYDAHVIEQFEHAGAVLLGKTNMDEFAMGSSNETSHLARCATPGTGAWCRGAPRGARRRRSPRAWRRRRPAPIPAARFASRRP